MKDKLLIIPDVHGRTFWKGAMDERYKDHEIVFLGDYLDPYPFEFKNDNNFRKIAIDNFKEILLFAKENQERVHLLIGNHDAHMLSLSNDICRMDIGNAKEIFDLFCENKDLFNIGYIWNNIIMTHAGITKQWLRHTSREGVSAEAVVDDLNKILRESKWEAPSPTISGEIRNYIETDLGRISTYRGGWHSSGSPIWADVREHLDDYEDLDEAPPTFNGYIQIFGHTMLKNPGTFIQKNDFWMIDGRSLYEWNKKENKIEAICQ